MGHDVFAQVSPLAEAASAVGTHVRLLSVVRAHVVLQVEPPHEHLAALATAEHAATLMNLGEGVVIAKGGGYDKGRTSQSTSRKARG